MTQKISNYGAEHPVVARVSFQWLNLLPWFDLSDARRSTAGETLLLKVQPRVLAALEAVTKCKPALSTEASTEALKQWSNGLQSFHSEVRTALEEFARLPSLLLGRKAPEQNYAALAKWAEKWFGRSDPLTQALREANRDWIRRIYDAPADDGAGQDSVARAKLYAEMELLSGRLLPFVEEVMVTALAHRPTLAAISVGEIPEAKRDPAAPVRFHAIMKDGTGKWVPAGKPSKAGSVIPELQRLLQQGRGRPIIATKFHNEWFVASGSKMYHSPKWKNFHDFLGAYIKDILGGPWANEELKKPYAERHPLMAWYADVANYTNAYIKEGKGAPMTALPAAYLGLAYDLYLISHNNGKIHELLIRRLQHRDQFFGAYFETRVAGIMIRAGFDIELEDETDSSTSHCEFTATHRDSGQKLSVEAKIRLSTQQPPEVGRQLYNALRKHAKHARLVFIEVNDTACPPQDQEKLLRDLLQDIRSREATAVIDGVVAPPAYLVISNNPPATVDRPHAPAYMFEGFKIPDFRMEGTHASLRKALESRQRHVAMNALIESLHDFTRIPSSFDGEVEAFAAAPPQRGRLLIGQPYRITTPQGDVTGILTQAIIMPAEKAALCCLSNEGGQGQMVTVPLTEQEMRAYHESPRTFFGREEPETKIKSPLKFYDWMLSSYSKTPKERLLQLFAEAGAKDVAALSALPQERLAEIFAERMTESIIVQTGLGRPPSPPPPNGPEATA